MADLDQLIPEVIAWCSANGLLFGDRESAGPIFTHLPISLLPIRYPRSAFDHAKSIAQDFNILIDRISRRPDWIVQSLESVLSADDFTSRLVDILKQVNEEGIKQTLYLGIHRSDYMLHSNQEGKVSPYQVEINTIASSFGCLSAKASILHRFILERYSHNPSIVEHFPELSSTDLSSQINEHMPDNHTLIHLPAAISHACQAYSQNKDTAVIFVVQEGETNSVDQRLLEYALWKDYQIPVYRCTFDQIHTETYLGPNSQLILTIGGREVEIAVVYFRAGYTPRDLTMDHHWQARLLIERSKAIKCPSIAYHLVGAKKIQQILANPGILEQFVEEERANRLRSVFAGLWALGGEGEIKTDVIEHPEKYVMKPQREGGGNNLYGQAIVAALQTMSKEELSAFILMERLFPPPQHGALLRRGSITNGNCLSELGIFGTYLGNGEEVLRNEYSGFLIRTKLDGTDEGGVATGFSVLNTPFLE